MISLIGCCFAGHSNIYIPSLQEKLYNKAAELIEEENVKTFSVGNYGYFDLLSASVIRKMKEHYPDIELNLILPYLTADLYNNKEIHTRYDNILIADIPPNTPRRFHIIKANEYMINHSSFLICYVDHPWGGAAKTLEYAKRKTHIKIFNLAVE